MKKINALIVFFMLTAVPFIGYSQVAIGTNSPSDAAALEVSSQIDGVGPYKGLMPPRVPLETDRDAIPTTPADNGLLVFVEATGCLDIFNGSFWEHIKCSSTVPPVPFAPPSSDDSPSSMSINQPKVIDKS